MAAPGLQGREWRGVEVDPRTSEGVVWGKGFGVRVSVKVKVWGSGGWPVQ